MEVYTLAEGVIRRKLKAPSTAKFASFLWNPEDIKVMERKDGSYLVGSWVDVQNSFGAMIRSHWVCELKEKTPGEWIVSGVWD